MSDINLTPRKPSIVLLTTSTVAILSLLNNAVTDVYMRIIGIPDVGMIPARAYITLSGIPITTLSGEYLIYV